MRIRASLLAVVVVATIIGPLTSTRGLAQGRVVVFGDSLSDNGNLFAQTGQPPAPYFQGRFSNGPVWVEQLFGPLNSPIQGTGVAGNVDLAFGGDAHRQRPQS